MCWKYKNSHGTVFVWCEVASGKEHKSGYIHVFLDKKDNYSSNHNYCSYCGKKLETVYQV